MTKLASTEEMAERMERMKTPAIARVFDPNCEHKDGGHHMIEFLVQDEPNGPERMARLYQCNLCGQKVNGND